MAKAPQRSEEPEDRLHLADRLALRPKEAAEAWERTARLRPPGSATPALLYWAGRAHLALGRRDRSLWRAAFWA